MGWIERWLDLSLRTKCLLLISFPAAATVAMAGASYLVGTETAAATEQLNRSLRIGIEIESLRASEIEASADVRAYLISADERFASKTRMALAAFDTAWQSLSELTTDDPAQRLRLAHVATLERSRVERIVKQTLRFGSGSVPPGSLVSSLEAAETERLALERILEGMQEANGGAIRAYLVRVDQLRGRQNGLMAIGVFLGLAGGVIMTLLFAQGITGRIGKIQENIAQLAAGTALDRLPGRDEIGALSAGLVGIDRLISQQRAALEHAPSGIAEVDGLGCYRWTNRAYARLAGLSEVYRPRSVHHTLPAVEHPKIDEAMDLARAGNAAGITARIELPNGPASEVEMSFLEAPGLPGDGFYVFLREIVCPKADERDLIRAKDAAVASNRTKSDFLARISHDIRTPLNAILGTADLLSQTALSFDQSEYVHMFQRNCRRLLALINDFLDFSRIEAGAVQIEKAPFQIREIVSDVVATFGDTAARKGLVLGVDIDPRAPEWLLGDALRIQQVLVNLLSNALKFTTRGLVHLRVKVVEAQDPGENPRLRYEVLDTGPGISPEDQDKVFLKFMQLPNQTAGQRGTGLGLTICRDLVELMGGEIGVSSPAGGGSNFYFHLPLEVAPGGPLALPPASRGTPSSGKLPASTKAVRILVAEDTEDNRLLLEHYLRSERVELRFAFTGREAVDLIEHGEQFDLILMDIDMPVLDGYGAAQEIRIWEKMHARSTPIVALSADAMSEAVRSSLDAGCVAHVAKPIDRATLLSTIQRYATPGSGLPNAPVPRPTAVSPQVLALVPQYLASKQKQIAEARDCLTARDFGPIRRFGHNLKGTGSGYGFPDIEEMGRKIERAAAEADIERIAEQLEALHRFVSESGAPVAVPVFADRANGSRPVARWPPRSLL